MPLGYHTLVHALCFYGGLGIFALSAYPIYLIFWHGSHHNRHERAEIVISIASALATFGSGIKLISYINNAENGLFVWFMIGHIFICFATAITLTMTMLVTKYLWRDTFALIDAYGAISFGYILSILITTFVHSDDDRFFTKVGRAAWRNFWVMVVQLIIFFLLLLYKVISLCWKDKNEMDLEYETELAEQGPLMFDEKANIGSKFFGKLAQAQPMAILLATFFFIILKLPQFASLFWMTESQGDYLLVFFALGSIFGSCIFSFPVIAFPGKYRCLQITFEVLYVLSIICLLWFATFENLNLLCFIVFLIGLFLAILTAQEFN